MKTVIIMAIMCTFAFGKVIPSEIHIAKQKLAYAEKILKKISKSVAKGKKIRTYRVKSVRMVIRAFEKNRSFEDEKYLKLVLLKIQSYNLTQIIL